MNGPIAVLAGTPVDTRMGVAYLEERGLPGVPFPLSRGPREQTAFQHAPAADKRRQALAVLRGAMAQGCRRAFVYCNSLSAAVDFPGLVEETGMRIVTPLDVYRRLALRYRALGVIAANAQGLSGIEKVLLEANPALDLLGACALPVVLAVEAGITLLYETELTAAREGEEECQITARGPYQEIALSGKYLIDATGNASLVQALGGETEAADERERMIATLMFRISNVDLDQLDAFIHSPRLGETIRQGRESGVLKGGILAFTPIPGTRDVSLNVTRAKFDHEDLADATRGMVELRSQIEPIFRFVQREVPGLEGAYLSGIAPLAGVRDARRIRGAYRLTIEDLERMTCFEDRVACGCYPMDLHDPVTNTVVWKMLPGVYHIPYRSLLPLGMKRTLAAGKCLSADPKAFGAVRVMPIMMNVGESAGYAAALALRENKTLDQISSASLRSCLDQKYGV